MTTVLLACEPPMQRAPRPPGATWTRPRRRTRERAVVGKRHADPHRRDHGGADAGREEARRLRPTRGVAHDRPVPSDVEAPARRPAGVGTMLPGAEQRGREEGHESQLPWERRR